MGNFKIGDKVEYEEDSEGERFGVESELLEAYGCSKGKSVKKEGYMLKAQKHDDNGAPKSMPKPVAKEAVELEETKAADSIKMDSGYNTSVMASNMIKAMGSLPKSDQVAFFDKMMSDCLKKLKLLIPSRWILVTTLLSWHQT